jgi:hypothetical protein
MNCPIERDLYRHLDQVDADQRRAEQAAALAMDPEFVKRKFADREFWNVLSGTGKELPNLTCEQQIANAEVAQDSLGLYMAGLLPIADLVKALEACKPAFAAWLDSEAEDEVGE